MAWVTSLAKKHKFIKGIVGGLDLTQVIIVIVIIVIISIIIIVIVIIIITITIIILINVIFYLGSGKTESTDSSTWRSPGKSKTFLQGFRLA